MFGPDHVEIEEGVWVERPRRRRRRDRVEEVGERVEHGRLMLVVMVVMNDVVLWEVVAQEGRDRLGGA